MSTSTVTGSPARFRVPWLGAVMAIAVFGALIVGWVSLAAQVAGDSRPTSAAEPMSERVAGGI